MLDVRRLQMLAELRRLGTIAAVADELHLTASAVSMQLTALEREVGLALTERRGRRVALTPAGEVLAEHGRRIFDLVSVAEMEVDALHQGESGSYRVAAFPTAAGSYVPEAWARLRDEAGPALRLVELEPEPAIAALVAGEVDLAVIHSYSNVPRPAADALLTTPLVTEEVLLAMPADAAPVTTRSGAARLADQATSDWVVPHAGLTCAEMVQRACAAAGFQPQVAAEATDYAVQLRLVAAGIGVALVPRLAARDVPDGVALVPLHPAVERHHFALTRPSAADDTGMRRIVESVRQSAAGAVAAGGRRQATAARK